jgi:hypothetical protein
MRGAAAVGLVAIAIAGCGFNVAYPDLFLFSRTGPGGKLTLLVNNSGTASCNRSKTKPISSRQLIVARDLADSLATDATKSLSLKPPPGSVYSYVIRMQQGTIRFPDTAGRTHKELAQAELFFLQTLQNVCGGS